MGFVFFVLFAGRVSGQTVLINEFMASNFQTLSDEDGDFEDWIELYNYGEEEVNLSGWTLSDDFGNPQRWVFPDTVIGPGDFLLVWASGKDRKDSTLHTNFSISSDGEELILANSGGNWVDLVPATSVPTDVSYGRKPDGGMDWYYFDVATPGEANITQPYEQVLEPPVFSHTSTLYSDDFQLVLSHPDPDVTIFYTLDGSGPSKANLEGTEFPFKNQYVQNPGQQDGTLLVDTLQTFEYGEPIDVQNIASQPDRNTHKSSTWEHEPTYFPGSPVNKATVVRAVAWREGALSSPVATETFFHEPSGSYDLSITSITINADMLYGYHKGIYVAGADFDSWRDENPDEYASGNSPANYRRRGVEYEYPAHFQLFDADSQSPVLSQDIGLRIHGGWSRSFPQKSFRLYARNAYGPSRFHHRVFNELPYDSYNRLLLRTSGNDFYSTMFRDAFMQTLTGHMNFDTQAYEPTVLFVNGEYWGIHNLRERYDKHYLERVYGVDPDNIDLLTAYMTVKEGDAEHYENLLEYIENNDMSEEEHFQYILTQMDVDNYIDYQLSNIYLNNTDWPAGNIDFWRLRTQEYLPDAPPGHDGRWRWMLFDTDFGYGLMGGSDAMANNTLEHATADDSDHYSNPPWSTIILRNLLENQQFRHQFINRFADQLNTAFDPARVDSLIGSFEQRLTSSIEEHIHRWSRPGSYNQWVNNIQVMRGFGQARPGYQRQHLKDFFGLEGQYLLTLDVSNPDHGFVKVNTVEVTPSTPGVSENTYPWRGTYFKDVPVEVTAVPSPGFVFSHWEGHYSGTENPVKINPEENVRLTAHFIRSDEPTLLAFWLFDETLPNDTPLESIQAHYSLLSDANLEYHSSLPQYPYSPEHPLWRVGSMERRNRPTQLNYRPEGNEQILFEQSGMRGLQVRKPFEYEGEVSEMVFHLPACGVRDLVFRFAAKDEDAAESLMIDYNVQEELTWENEHVSKGIYPLTDTYQLFEIDFSEMDRVNNNPWFKIRIRMDGEANESMDEGRVTFNNITLDGKMLLAYYIDVAASGHGEMNPAGRIRMFEGESKTFVLVPGKNHVLKDLLLDGESVLDQVSFHPVDNTAFYTLTNPESNHSLQAVFELDPAIFDDNNVLIIYPNPTQDDIHVQSLYSLHKFELFDLNGRKLGQQQMYDSRDSIDLRFLGPGLYIGVFHHEQGVESRKIQVLPATERP